MAGQRTQVRFFRADFLRSRNLGRAACWCHAPNERTNVVPPIHRSLCPANDQQALVSLAALSESLDYVADCIEQLLPSVAAAQAAGSTGASTPLTTRPGSPTRHHRKGHKGSSLSDTLGMTADR